MAHELRMVAISPAVGIPPTPETDDTSGAAAAGVADGTDVETIASPDDEIVMEMVVVTEPCAYIIAYQSILNKFKDFNSRTKCNTWAPMNNRQVKSANFIIFWRGKSWIGSSTKKSKRDLELQLSTRANCTSGCSLFAFYTPSDKIILVLLVATWSKKKILPSLYGFIVQ